ncbi:ABC1 kinase family protein [Microbacterium halotolerans]|uniref:ABC1 kinase family protein n=1 Tax=Microbacterium halotolerans TaxID=246613 RepID=UPI001F091D8D|nr:AarF/UbiB family protein [Microbacterium halotolerans]
MASTGRAPGGAKDSRARYRRIVRFAARQLANEWWHEILLPKVGLGRITERTRARRMTRFARGFREMAIGLGGLMIKVGQFMSSRLDVLPPELTRELEGLQDEVPAESFDDIRALAEAELGMPLERAYAGMDETPVAAASLGQAHRARLRPQDAEAAGFADVVVKVQRPGIDGIVETDLRALRKVAGWLNRFRAVSDRVDPPALVDEFAQVCRDEIDYLHEAAGCERFAEELADDERVGVPEIAWERTTRRVLTLEDVTAIKITDVDALRSAGIDPTEVAPVFAAVMFDQLFSHGYFHADPHPGNIFVVPGDGGSWRLMFVDFGMMGEVPQATRRGLRRLVIAMAARDGSGLVAAAREIGVLLPTADTTELERALARLFDRFGGMGFSELRDVDPREFREFANEFGEVVRTLPIQLPEHLLLVIRAASLTSGVATALDPEFNIWDSVEPYADRLVRDESAGFARDLLSDGLDSLRIAWRMPKRLDALIGRIEDGDVAVSTPQVERRLSRLESAVRRTISAVLFAGLLVGGAVLQAVEPVPGIVLMSASALPLLHALFARRR